MFADLRRVATLFAILLATTPACRPDPPPPVPVPTCEAGDALACVAEGSAALEGSGGRAVAAEAFAASCHAGHAPGCMTAVAVGAPLEDRADLLAAACQLDPRYCLDAGRRLQAVLEDPASRTMGALAFVAGCEADDGAACLAAGRAHRSGRGVDRDDVSALRWYRRGCALGVAEACHVAGVLIRDGQGAEADPVAASELFAQACDGGFVFGCTARGVALLREGSGDAGAAMEMLGSACERGDVEACRAHGRHLLAGAGGGVDPAAAATAFSRACNAGDHPACTQYARMQLVGLGVPRDPDLARELFVVSCRSGRVGEACWELSRIYAEMEGDDFAERSRLARESACSLGVEVACP